MNNYRLSWSYDNGDVIVTRNLLGNLPTCIETAALISRVPNIFDVEVLDIRQNAVIEWREKQKA